MRRRGFLLGVAPLLWAHAVSAEPVMAADAAPPLAKAHIEVRGGASVSAAPDTAVVTVTVKTRANAPHTALADNAADAARVLAFCASAGIGTPKIRSGPVRVTPRFTQANDGSGPRLANYEATNFLRVTLSDLTKVDGFVRDVLHHGAETVQSVDFTLADQGEMESRARAAAFENATHKAKEFAELAKLTLADVVRITYPSPNEDKMRYDPGVAVDLSKPLLPNSQLDAGVVLIRAEVDVTWSTK